MSIMPRLLLRRVRSGPSPAGFTLIELLTSLALMGLVAGAIATVFSSSIGVRRVVQSQLDTLGEVHTLARLAREDLAHLAALPHALAVEGETLALLRVVPPSRGDESHERLRIVRYRRDRSTATSGAIVREELDVDPRALLAWSEDSLGDGAGSVLPLFVTEERSTPVFRLPRPVEWQPMEYENGEWRVSDGESPSTVRAIDLCIRSARAPRHGDIGPETGIDRPWIIRIALPVRPAEKVGS